MKIGVFGGTFNPPHTGHVQSAETAAQKLGLDLLIVVPAGNPPHKKMPEGTPAANLRFEMVRMAFMNTHSTVVSDIEISGGSSGYTIDSIDAFSKDYPGAEFFLLVGTDMYLTLESWRESERLLCKATPAVFTRNTGDSLRLTEYSRALNEEYGADTMIIDNEIIDISSSQLRDMLQTREGLRYIPDTIYAYIIKNRLYSAKPDWDWLRDRAYSMLASARIPHVAGCEVEALRLAKRWGVDTDDAREAAILHDITKKLTPEENMEILLKHNITVEKLEPGEEKLLHSKTGAAIARSEFGVTEVVADAIMWHTTGRPGMSALEKIIYLADYIEPTRDFEEVGELRESAYNDIDAAMIMGLEISIEDLLERGKTPNRVTYDALSDLKHRNRK